MFDKTQKGCIKRIYLVTDDGLYGRKAFHKVETVFSSSSMSDGEFINYLRQVIRENCQLKTQNGNLP